MTTIHMGRLLMLALLLLSAACSKKEAGETEPVIPVQVVQASRASIGHFINASGVLYPRDQAGVTPKISAPVKKFLVNRGDRVSVGQVLAVLENRDLEAAVRDAKGQLDQAESNLRALNTASLPEETAKSQHEVEATKEAFEAAQKVLESRRQLFRDGAMARRLVDEAAVGLAQAKSQYETASKHLQTVQGAGRQEQVKSAEAQVEAARGRYENTQAQLAYSEVRSPIAGMIADRPLYAGEMASAGTPLLTVMDVSRVIARVSVPATDAAALHRGNPATIHTPNGEAAGKVTVVSPAVDPQSTTIEVWVEVENPNGLLKPGAAVQASILAGTVANALVVPTEALLPAQDASNEVLVVGADSVAHERKVQVGVRDAGKAQVLSGLRDGEAVVTVGGLGVQDGAKVKVTRE
ncbi:MAG: efflux RND transporter periplasmic adaptor subunit [Bryobacteraceae bacterium]|jgi:multidrug efflux pump subunit AcrA (membrane-fusion protein)